MKKVVRSFAILLCVGLLLVGCSNSSNNSYNDTPTVSLDEAKSALWREVYEKIGNSFDPDIYELNSYWFTDVGEEGDFYVLSGAYQMDMLGTKTVDYGFRGKVHKQTGTASVETIFGAT